MATKTTLPSPLFDTLEKQTAVITTYPYQKDIYHAIEFIKSYRGSAATFNAYRREVERLLQWCTHIVHKSLSALKQQDIEAFIQFCQQPPLEWIALKKCDRFIEKDGLRQPNPEWRPFVVSLSKTSRRLGNQPDYVPCNLVELSN